MSAGLRRIGIWSLLLLLSLLLHVFLSREAGRGLGISGSGSDEASAGREVAIELEAKPAQAEKPPDPLDFEDEPELEPPPTLVRGRAVEPPPPSVDLAMKAAAGAGSTMPLSLSAGATPAALGLEVEQRGARGMGNAGFGTGIGNGLDNSSNRFAAYVQGLRESGLDVVFVIDATGSMDWVIDEVRRRVTDIVDTTRSLVPLTRFGIVAYRDYDDPQFVVRQQPLSFSLAKLARFLDALEAKGGGSWQEAVKAGLEGAMNHAGWRPGAKRVVLLIGDAPPHEDELDATVALARELARSGGQLSTLDLSHESNPALLEAHLGRKVNRALYRDRPMLQFESIAEAGDGNAATLDGDIRITRQLVSLIMGGQFAAEMKLLLEGL